MYRSLDRHQNQSSIDSRIDVTLISFALFALLFNILIGPLTPIILSAIVVSFFILRRTRFVSIMSSAWPVLALPALAIFSSLWSVDAGITIKSGILYLLTILLALIFGCGVKREDLIKAIFFTFFIFCNLSWLWGYSQIDVRAFQGLLASKNAMGEVGGTLAVAAICVFFDPHSHDKPLLRLLSVFGFFIGAMTLWFSEATTATIATAISAVCSIAWLITLRLDAQSRLILLISTLLFSAGMFGIFIYFQDHIFDYVLGISGKDTTLTGRTDLWLAADDLIAQRPWLGVGYNAFWSSGNLEAESLWREFGIENRSGFNFHNTYREIAVHLGFSGLFLFFVVSFVGALGLFKNVVESPNAPLIFLSAMLLGSIIKAPFESIGFGSMQLFGVLAFAAISAGYKAFRISNCN